MILSRSFCNLRHRYVGSNQCKKGCNVQLGRLRSQILNQKTKISYCFNLFDISISKGLNKQQSLRGESSVPPEKASVLPNGKDSFTL